MSELRSRTDHMQLQEAYNLLEKTREPEALINCENFNCLRRLLRTMAYVFDVCKDQG